MSILNHGSREICAKIVYYGPGLSGKTTTLQRVYESVKPTHRGEMLSLATEGDRTLFFDFLPIKVDKVGDYTVRLALYTVPGQVFYNATRKLVLNGADGVVFVADSQPAAMDKNTESLENLRENLVEMGESIESFPLVVQYNKRDIPNVLPVSDLRGILNPRGVPDFETVAQKGIGVLDGLRAITRSVIKNLKDKGVVSKRPNRPAVPTVAKEPEQSIASQMEELAADAEPELPSAQAAFRPAVPAELLADPSLIPALVPERLTGEAALAEADYRAGMYRESCRRAMDALKSIMADLGSNSFTEVERALLAGLWGPDYARMLRIASHPTPTREDAAFALVMLAMAGLRQKR